MRIALFGANGGTGRHLTRQALDAGHHVVAVTRRPRDFPFRHSHLSVFGGDALEPRTAVAAIAGTDAVLSALGVPFTRAPIAIYSKGIANIITAMAEHDVRRIIAVSSAATDPRPHADGGFLMNRVMQPLVTATIGKTTYADMRQMEMLLRSSDLDWTVIRPSGLFDTDAVSTFHLEEEHSPGIFTSRPDLAASMLAQLSTDRWLRRTVAVTTSEGTPTMWQMIRREAFSA